MTNKFTQLTEDLKSGELSLTHVQIAIRIYVRDSKQVPNGVKDLLCGANDSSSGLIYKMFMPIQQVIGSMELAYRRGKLDD